MNLRPRQINFEEAWKELRNTVEAIVQLQYVKRITWDHNFRYHILNYYVLKSYLSIRICCQKICFVKFFSLLIFYFENCYVYETILS